MPGPESAENTKSLQVAGLWIYPVKSGRGIALTAVDLDALGFRHDRRFVIVGPDGRALTQRTHPSLARLETAVTSDALVLKSDTGSAMSVPLEDPTTDQVLVQIWSDTDLRAESCGAEADAWVSEFIGTASRLARIGTAFTRPVRNQPLHQVHFGDAYPLLVVSQGSLDELNQRLAAQGAEPVGIERFRPNILIAGGEPHEEDQWADFRIGELQFHGATPCVRCIMVTADPRNGTRGPEPLRTLATYRRNPANPQQILFGRNVVNLSTRGRIRLGDDVRV